MSQSKSCLLVEVLRDVQDDTKVNLNNSGHCGTKRYVSVDDFNEKREFE